MRRTLFGVALLSIVAWWTPAVRGFCGFYVAKADTKLFNKASQVVLVRDGIPRTFGGGTRCGVVIAAGFPGFNMTSTLVAAVSNSNCSRTTFPVK